MTCIVGIQTKDGALLAADSLGANSYVAETRRDPKLFYLGQGVAIGITGSYRMGQVIHVHLKVPELDVGDPWEWCVRRLVPALQSVLSEHGVEKKEHDVASMDSGSFLLTVRGRVFEIGRDYQVAEQACGYTAVGSGASVALGALSALTAGTNPAVTITRGEARVFAAAAIEAAEEHTPWVRGPVNFMEMP